jgi:phage replication-related protein YjqB (UPF0714/DUF867 family)
MRFATLLATPGVVEHVEIRSTFGFMAFHGGNLERMTDEIAMLAAERAGASVYCVVQPYPLREHLPSNQVRPEESPKLASFLDHVDHVIAIHGYGREGLWSSMLLGGGHRELAATCADNLRTYLPEFHAVDDVETIPSELRGMHPHNPVNRARLGGVQLELPPRVRGLTPHAATMERFDGRIAWTNSLIDALVATAHSFTTAR